MKISDEAVEAACDYLSASNGGAFRPDREFVRKVLEAAAPHIAGVAWDQGWYAADLNSETNPYRSQS